MRIDPARDALVIVDVQPDFMPGGALAVEGGDQVVAPIAALAPRFSTVVATQDFHPRGHVSFAAEGGRWPEHCVAGTAGAALHRGLPDAALDLILRKGTRREVDAYSAFRDEGGVKTGLAGWLAERRIERIFVCGLALDFCVRATALDGAAAGFAVAVLGDLTRAVSAAGAEEARAALRAAGVAWLSSTEIAS